MILRHIIFSAILMKKVNVWFHSLSNNLCDDNYLIHICKQIGLGMNYRRIHSILGMGPNPWSKQTFYISVNITYVQDVPFQTRNPFEIISIVVLKVGRCSGSANKNRQWAALLPSVQFMEVHHYREDFHRRVFVNEPHQWKGSDPGEWVILAGLTLWQYQSKAP